MGFLGLFKKRDEEPAPVPKASLRLDELKPWLSENFGESIEQSRKHASGLCSSVLESLDKVLSANSLLDKKDIEGKDRIRSSARMIKTSFVQRTKSSFSGKECVEPVYSRLSEFHSRNKSAINEMLSMPSKHAILLSRYFGREAQDLIISMKKSLERLDELGSFLKADARILRAEESVDSGLRKRAELLSSISDTEKVVSRLTEDSVKRGAELEESRKALDSFLKSREWSELEDARKGSSSIDNRIRDTELEIANLISSSRRPIKKIAHETGDSSLDSFLKDPVSSILSGHDFSGKLEKALSENTLPEKEASKLERLISDLRTRGKELSEEHRKLLSEREENDRLISSSPAEQEKERLEDEVRSRELSLKRVSEELKSSKERLSALKEDLSRLKKDLLGSVSADTGAEIELN